MARRHRVWFEGATYHITSRGNRRELIFYDDQDRRKYLNILQETRGKYPHQLHSYCMMPNHIHLLLETEHVPIQHIMKMINTRYAIYFNKRHELVGHVFQGRYGSKLVNSIKYFIDVSRYIHLNPVRANMVEKLEDYPWSSYTAYMASRHNPLVKVDRILSYFPGGSKENYRQFCEKAVDEEPAPLSSIDETLGFLELPCEWRV